jgi:hypothetical protein
MFAQNSREGGEGKDQGRQNTTNLSRSQTETQFVSNNMIKLDKGDSLEITQNQRLEYTLSVGTLSQETMSI